MTASDWLRTKDAAARAKVDPGTLARWAARGLISTTKAVGCRYYSASDIDALLERGSSGRTVTPIRSRPASTQGYADWQGLRAWAARERGAQGTR